MDPISNSMLREIDGCVCAGEMLYFPLLQCGLRIDNMGNISVARASEPNKAETRTRDAAYNKEGESVLSIER